MRVDCDVPAQTASGAKRHAGNPWPANSDYQADKDKTNCDDWPEPSPLCDDSCAWAIAIVLGILVLGILVLGILVLGILVLGIPVLGIPVLGIPVLGIPVLGIQRCPSRDLSPCSTMKHQCHIRKHE